MRNQKPPPWRPYAISAVGYLPGLSLGMMSWFGMNFPPWIPIFSMTISSLSVVVLFVRVVFEIIIKYKEFNTQRVIAIYDKLLSESRRFNLLDKHVTMLIKQIPNLPPNTAEASLKVISEIYRQYGQPPADPTFQLLDSIIQAEVEQSTTCQPCTDHRGFTI